MKRQFQTAVGALVVATVVGCATAQQTPLRDLDATTPYRTPRSGEGVTASVFGSRIDVEPRDRRHVFAWQGGVDTAAGAEDGTVPYASIYYWDRPDRYSLLRISASGLYDEVLYARAGREGSEWVATFENFNLPWASGEWVDGDVDEREELVWGYARGGLGIGFRFDTEPYETENMLASHVILEPGVLWFGRGDDSDPAFAPPDSAFELRLRWQLRYDALERNLLELPHEGLAFGADFVQGWRAGNEEWGLPGSPHAPLSGGNYDEITGYAYAISAMPWIGGERLRVHGSVHAGTGDDLDRFSAQRVGGGPDLRGGEFGTTARPVLPGTAWGEFFPDHYVVASVGWRYELAFFAYVDVDGTAAWLDRDRNRGGGVARESDELHAISARLTTAFVGRTRLVLGYGHCFDAVRDGERGGDEFVLQLSGRF